MSGFGRAASDQETSKETGVTIEIKSVNSKSADISVKCSSRFAFLEEWIRGIAKERLSRGKIDISLYVTGAQDTAISADFDVLDRVDTLFRSIEKRYRLKRTKNIADYLRLDGALVFKRAEWDEEALKNAVAPVLMRALDALLAMRATEGRHLSEDIELKLQQMEVQLDMIENARAEMVRSKFETMKNRIEALLGDRVDEQLILQEAAVFAEKVDIEEEVVRLRTHFKHMRSLLKSEEPVGRKLDFISQELLRETNTIGSKSPDEGVVACVIELKSIIDRIKEQVQNIL
ncbi:MAG: YicC/YloC family endoribonuclease [Bacillota bacterium]|nr:YicC/YloC family endoribonuclease [Bacillota bacterium]